MDPREKALPHGGLVARFWECLVPTSRHEGRYRASLVVQERVGCCFCLFASVAFVLTSIITGGVAAQYAEAITPLSFVWLSLSYCALVGVAFVSAIRVWRPLNKTAHMANVAVFALGGVVLVALACANDAKLNRTPIVVRRLFLMKSVIAGSFFMARRHGRLVLAWFAVVAIGLLPSLRHLDPEFREVLAGPYIIAVLILITIFLAFDIMSRRSFLASVEIQDLKDIEIAALTQISHVIKNKLNFVESMLPDWRERISKQKIEDPHNEFGRTPHIEDFGMMEFCVRASLDAVMYVSILRSIKSGVYETVMAATQVDQWVAEYATNHDLSYTPVPAGTRSFDVRVVGFVLEDGWSNALKYGDGSKFRPEILARLPEGRIEVSITNRQMPGKRLQEDTEALFERGVTGTQATLLSEGFGLADARQAAEAAGGTVSLSEQHSEDGAWYTTFTVALPTSHSAECVVEIVPEPEPEPEPVPEPELKAGRGGASSRYFFSPAGQARIAAELDNTVGLLHGACDTTTAGQAQQPFPKDLTILAVDDEGTQRKVLEKIFLGKLEAAENSKVLGKDLAEIRSVVPLAKTLNADIVILDQNLTHGDVSGTQLADALRADGYGGFIVLRTGSTAETLRKFQGHKSVDLAIGKAEHNLTVVEAIKRGYGPGPVAAASGAVS